ncbi:MAG: CBS domain-containing protein [Gammaproteobacteria bacterium]
MKLKDILITTKTATRDMNVRELVIECTRANIPGLPFTTPSGRISGRVTLKNILKLTYLPDYIIESARFLGDQLFSIEDLEAKTKQMMENPVETYAQEAHLTIPSDATAIKALAMMEQNDTSYIFVVDDDLYLGVVTMQSLARKFLSIDEGN